MSSEDDTAKKDDNVRASAAHSEDSGPNQEDTGFQCVECGARKTPMRRNGPAGPKTLCNACGVKRTRLEAKKERKRSAGVAYVQEPADGQTPVEQASAAQLGHASQPPSALTTRRQRKVQSFCSCAGEMAADPGSRSAVPMNGMLNGNRAAAPANGAANSLMQQAAVHTRRLMLGHSPCCRSCRVLQTLSWQQLMSQESWGVLP
ncbi:hypothetical protein WJX73_002318 [Symbiochloris irregularis]|uniref:GATA-type domain-containing protein n=1 Tax=Symbiochloris irregularis TaxID=706552 RepID=A0AAW1NKH0_9CHLO